MSVASWMQQAKEVTKKLSDMMYIPPEDANDAHPVESAGSTKNGSTLKPDHSPTQTECSATEVKRLDVADNNELMKEHDSSVSERENEPPADLFYELKVGENAAAAVETAKKVASKSVQPATCMRFSIRVSASTHLSV